MSRNKEQSVIDGFFEHLRRSAKVRGRPATRFSLDGQDTTYGDYVFTDNTKFVLVEFKWDEGGIAKEGEKYRRLKMCELLNTEDSHLLPDSLECHYIAYSHAQNQIRKVRFESYYRAVCSKQVFPQSNLLADLSDRSTKTSADDLIDGFLNETIGGTYSQFKGYTEWLESIDSNPGGGSGGGAMEILLNNPDSDQLELLEFRSLPLLKEWLDQNMPKSRHTNSYF